MVVVVVMVTGVAVLEMVAERVEGMGMERPLPSLVRT